MMVAAKPGMAAILVGNVVADDGRRIVTESPVDRELAPVSGEARLTHPVRDAASEVLLVIQFNAAIM